MRASGLLPPYYWFPFYKLVSFHGLKLQESLEKAYEREGQEQNSTKNIPHTAPAALSVIPPSWPNVANRKPFQDNIDANIFSAEGPKEISDPLSIASLAISSRESSIDNIITTSASKTPDVLSALVHQVYGIKTLRLLKKRKKITEARDKCDGINVNCYMMNLNSLIPQII